MSETKRIPQARTKWAQVKWKTKEDFEAMTVADLRKYLPEYQEIKRTGVLIKQGGRGLSHAEMIQLNFYIEMCESELRKRGEEA